MKKISPMEITEPAQLAPYIQHTRIAIGTTREEAIQHAEEALKYGFDAAMVAGSRVPETAEVLKGTDVEIATALDFPTTGVMSSYGKAKEAEELVRLGATQIDIGVQVGWLKDGDYDRFRDDIAGVVACGIPIKVMLELPLLTEEEKKIAVELAVEAGAKYLKNASSGSVGKATPEEMKFLCSLAPEGVFVKGSGGISTFEHALSLIQAGAVLVGSSNSIAIVTGNKGGDSY